MVVQQKIDYFYGIFVNKAQKIKKSSYLKENESCVSRIQNEIKKGYLGGQIFENDSFFLHNSLISFNGNQRILFSNSYKTVVLLYSYKQGVLNRSDFKLIKEQITEMGYKLVIISIDPVYRYSTNLRTRHSNSYN